MDVTEWIILTNLLFTLSSGRFYYLCVVMVLSCVKNSYFQLSKTFGCTSLDVTGQRWGLYTETHKTIL